MTSEAVGARKPPRRPAGRGLGLRREVLILVPVNLLLLVLISTVCLVSYRNAIALLIDERQNEALELARRLAVQISSGERPRSASQLRRLAPAARGLALLGEGGLPILSYGDLPAAGGWPASQPSPSSAGTAAFAFGPDDDAPGVVVAVAPLAFDSRTSGAAPQFLRVDLDAAALGRQHSALRPLTAVVLIVGGAVVLLMLLFLRHLLRPYETLLERVRQVQGPEAAEVGDVELLVDTFDQAMKALVRSREQGAVDDIAVLEKTLSKSLESGVLLLDGEGGVLALNDSGRALLAVPALEAGTPIEDLLGTSHPVDRSEVLVLIQEAITTGQSLQRREASVVVDGKTRTLGLTISPLRRDEGGVRGFLVLFADLTEARRRADETRLAQSLMELGELAGGIAHELRNSLATVRGYLGLIERRPEEETLEEYLQEIRHEADHLQRILEDFLAFARPGSLRLEPVALDSLVRRALADPVLEGMAVDLDFDLSPDLNREGAAEGAALPPFLIQGDPQLLERLLRNLLHNACRAHREAGAPGPLESTLSTQQDGVRWSLRDRGPGLPKELRERLFQPFAAAFRGGVGLGLALAQRIVSLHGGRLRLQDRPGGGCEAVLWLPRRPPAG